MDTQLPILSNQTPLKSLPQIRKCEDLLLETFIQITLDGDHTRLNGDNTDKAWDAIRVEFESLSGGYGYSATINLLKDINYLSAKLQMIDELTSLMEFYYLPEMGAILAEYGMTYEWEGIDEEKYMAQLNMVRSRSKTWYVELKSKEKDWKLQNPESKSEAPVTREYFEDWLIALSKMEGYNIRANDITAFRFAIMVKKASQKPSQKK